MSVAAQIVENLDLAELTAEETTQLAKRCMIELSDNDVWELVTDWCRDDEIRTDELIAQLE